MKRLSLMWSLIIAAGFIVAQPSIGLSQNGKENTEARKLFNKGVEFHINKDYVEAEKRFREALWLYPNADQSDRTAFYLIDTLVKLRRVQEARAEAENFRKRHPQSKWDADVNEVILKMGGQL